MSQNARVLQLLQARGEDGIRPTDFLAPSVVDGGKPILRLPARIDELRKEGVGITTVSVRPVAHYRLTSLPEPERRLTPRPEHTGTGDRRQQARELVAAFVPAEKVERAAEVLCALKAEHPGQTITQSQVLEGMDRPLSASMAGCAIKDDWS
jgi:hypothetical protein